MRFLNGGNNTYIGTYAVETRGMSQDFQRLCIEELGIQETNLEYVSSDCLLATCQDLGSRHTALPFLSSPLRVRPGSSGCTPVQLPFYRSKVFQNRSMPLDIQPYDRSLRCIETQGLLTPKHQPENFLLSFKSISKARDGNHGSSSSLCVGAPGVTVSSR